MRGIEGLRAPLIGRDDELKEIRTAVADLSVVGEACSRFWLKRVWARAV